MGLASNPDLLVIHAVRVTGVAATGAIAERTDLRREVVEEHLLDDEARGWVRRVDFADLAGWTLTESGRVEDERRLADELERTGARPAVEGAHANFERLNARVLGSLTRWQIRPRSWDPLAANDHDDIPWDERVLDELASYSRRLGPLCSGLTAALDRFRGYDQRYAAALDRALRGQRAWVDGAGVDSCHTVWIQLHEDLLATLGLARGEGQASRTPW